jgi:hypothetical protein
MRVNGHGVRINDIKRWLEVNNTCDSDSDTYDDDYNTGSFHRKSIWYKCKINFNYVNP